MLHSARDAYSSGLHFAAVGGAVVLLVSALFAVRALREVPVPPPAPKKEKPGKPGKAAKQKEPATLEVAAEV